MPEPSVPVRSYTVRELANIIQAYGFLIEIGRGKEAARVTGGSLTRPVLVPQPHRGRRLRPDQVRYLLRELGVPVSR